MMTPALQEQLFHKHRKAIRLVRESLEKGSVVTIEGLMQEHGWCRTKAHSTLQTCWLLGILKAENTNTHEPAGPLQEVLDDAASTAK